MPAQRQQLENALECEDGNEDLVDVSQRTGDRAWLSVVLGRHADHVHTDDAHDGDLKFLIRDHFE